MSASSCVAARERSCGSGACAARLEWGVLDTHDLLALWRHTREREQLRLEDQRGQAGVHIHLEAFLAPLDVDLNVQAKGVASNRQMSD